MAIWDVQERKLVVARDAMGIKPVHRLDAGSLFFASEVRALVSSSPESISPDPVSLNLFLRYRYTPSPRTLFEGVSKLAPGTMLVVKDGCAEVKRWYRFEPEPFDKPKSLADSKAELLQLYKEALERHLISDVPVGLLLSGGIDSALLLALMNLYGSRWRTYTVGYGRSFQDDEIKDAERTAAILSSDHTSLEMSRSDFEQSLPKVIASLEEPIAASSIVPMYMICQRARQDVKVALIGQGPDELFGGYTRHLGVRYGAAWRALPGVVRQGLAGALAALPRNAALKRGLYALDVPDRFRRYQNVFSIMPGGVIDGLFRDGLLPPAAGDTILDCWADLKAQTAKTDELTGFQWLELQSSLPDELLMSGDKMSMAHGLEARAVSDRTVVEYARVSCDLKIGWARGSSCTASRVWTSCHEVVCRTAGRGQRRGRVVPAVSQRTDEPILQDSSLMCASSSSWLFAACSAEHRSAADHHKFCSA